jgi:lipid II isoglutaminyl synthase (glutamine-hydrolysing)
VRVGNRLVRALHLGKGTVAGGRLGLALDGDLLAHLLTGRTVVLISGTNGKTTTGALVRAGLGGAPAANLTGSNMPAGLIAALASNRDERAVLEVDEAFLPIVMAAAKDASQKVVVLLNLSRDQLDRAGEVRILADRWRSAFGDAAFSADWVVVANVNDPLVAYAVAPAAHVVACAVPTPWLGDAASCPICTDLITVRSNSDAESGEDRAWSSDCGFARPTPMVTVGNSVRLGVREIPLELSLPGAFNRANAVLALAAVDTLGVDPVVAALAMSKVTSVAGRFAIRTWRGRRFRLMLAKNPAGVAALVGELSASNDDLVVSINANIADGKDPSWLYDAPFEQFARRRTWCDGERALDLAARLEYGGVTAQLVEDDAKFPTSVNARDPIDVVANYTAFRSWLARSRPC